MTCIVGVAAAGRVVIGGDSAGVAGLDLRVRSDRKVFRNGSILVGFTSSFRMGQLLQYQLTVPKLLPDDDVMRWMVVDLVEAIRRCLKDGGFTTTKDSVEEGGEFLVGVAGRLFKIESDFQVGEQAAGFDACGCGETYALGALHACPLDEPERRVWVALNAAAEFSAGVRGPFCIEELPQPGADQ